MDLHDNNITILLVDDAQADLDAEYRTLESCKLLNPIHTFKRGDALVAYLKNAHAKSPPPHFVIFLDLLMKPDDGISTLRKLHQEKLTEGSIVVMLSGLTDVKLLHEGYQLGAHTFLVKPLKVEDVMELVSTLKNIVSVHSDENGNRLIWQKPAAPFRPKVL